MHVISKKRLRDFWKVYPDSVQPLRRWFKVAHTAEWSSIAEVRAVYPHADQVGRFTVFNIGGNKYRLITAIHYNRGRIYVRHVLAHGDYDRDQWKED